MIYKMNKYSFLVYHREYEAFLKKLRSLGVVHIAESKDATEMEELSALLEERKELDQLRRHIKSRRSKEAPVVVEVEVVDEELGRKVPQEAERLFEEEQRLQNEILSLKREIEHMEVWGDFDLRGVERLREAGYEVLFWSISASSYLPEWEEMYNAIVISTVRSQCHFVTVMRPGEEGPDAERVRLSDKRLNELIRDLKDLERKAEEAKLAVTTYADERLGEFLGYEKYLADKFNFGSALLQAETAADDRLMILTGWIPIDEARGLTLALEEEGYYFDQLEIRDKDRVPIKLKNNVFSRLFEPITKMYSLPNYNELDPTPLFAPFFVLFFALCFGDAGYGLILFLLATLFKRKTEKGSGMRSVATLVQVLGIGTIPIGLLVGTAFGLVMPWAAIDGKIGEAQRPDYFLNQDTLMYVSVGIGILQILFAKVVAGVKVSIQRGWKYGLNSFAWVVVILSVLLSLALPKWIPSFPVIGTYVLIAFAIAGAFVVLFYNSPGKNPLFNFGAGLWNTYNTASGLLGDTLSFIRLFAIGLTSGILGGVFNTLAWDMTEGSIVLRLTLMPLILLLGHGINFAMAIISSVVHPLRLTFVEYYKNSEFEGDGREYTPFKKL